LVCSFEEEEISLKEVLNFIFKNYAIELKERILTKDDKLRSNVRIFVDGHVIEDLEEKITSGEEEEIQIIVLGSMAGG